MKQINQLLPFLLVIAIAFSSCEVVGGIFKAGLWVGIILVVAVIALIFWLIRKVKR